MTMLSVIVLNYNGARHNSRCLRSLLSQHGDYEIVFADNASTDGSYESARSEFSGAPITWVQNGANLGYAGGNNAAARSARGEYLLFINNDTEAAPDFVEELLSCLKRSPGIAGGQCALIKDHDRNKLEAAGVDVDIFGFCYARDRDSKPESVTVERTIFTGVGAALVVARDWFNEAGGFDESYFLLYEETDLCWRINLFGGRLHYFPSARVYHVGSGTRVKGAFQIELFIANRMRTIRKNIGPALLPLSVFGNVTGMLALSAMYAMRRRPAMALAALRAIRAGLFDPDIPAARRRIQKRRRVTDLELIRNRQLRLPSPIGILRNSASYD